MYRISYWRKECVSALNFGGKNNVSDQEVVLAYSGGLDTSIIIPWLKENYNNPEIIAVSGDVGQNDELEGLEEKAIKTGAASCTSQTSPTRWWTRSSSLPEDGRQL